MAISKVLIPSLVLWLPNIDPWVICIYSYFQGFAPQNIRLHYISIYIIHSITQNLRLNRFDFGFTYTTMIGR